MKQIEIVEYSSEYRSSCIDLLKRTFPGSSNEETFSWRYEREGTGRPLMVCAMDGDRVVSFNSWVEWRFQYRDLTYRAYQSGDSATDEQYRRMGIWGKILGLGEKIARERGIDFFFGFPSAMSYGGFYKTGYQRVGAFPFSFRLINPMLRSSEEIERDLHEEITHRSLMEKDKISPVTDPDYFHWRYLKGPRKYEIIRFSEESNDATFVVRMTVYLNKRFGISVPELSLIDCHFSSLNQPFLKKAFRHLDRLYSRKAFWVRTFFNENTDKGKAMSPYFHIRLKARFETLIVKAMKQDLDYDVFFNCNNWDILPHVVDDY